MYAHIFTSKENAYLFTLDSGQKKLISSRDFAKKKDNKFYHCRLFDIINIICNNNPHFNIQYQKKFQNYQIYTVKYLVSHLYSFVNSDPAQYNILFHNIDYIHMICTAACPF